MARPARAGSAWMMMSAEGKAASSRFSAAMITLCAASSGQLRVELQVHLHVHIGARRTRPQLVHVGDLRVLGRPGPRSAPGASSGSSRSHQLVRGLAEHADRAPEQQGGDDQRRGRVDAGHAQPAEAPMPRSAMAFDASPRSSARGRPRPPRSSSASAPVPAGRPGGREPMETAITAIAQPSAAMGLGCSRFADRLAPDQRRRGEHQPALHQAREGFRLAVPKRCSASGGAAA